MSAFGPTRKYFLMNPARIESFSCILSNENHKTRIPYLIGLFGELKNFCIGFFLENSKTRPKTAIFRAKTRQNIVILAKYPKYDFFFFLQEVSFSVPGGKNNFFECEYSICTPIKFLFFTHQGSESSYLTIYIWGEWVKVDF